MGTTMSLSSFGLSASQLQSLPSAWSPLFDICHFILAALAVRKEVGHGFSRSNPLATWLANEFNVLLATLIWWGVFYSPGDLVYSLAKNQLLYVPICVVKEIYRAKKTLGGINDAAKVFPEQELLMVMIGLIKGNGSGFMK